MNKLCDASGLYKPHDVDVDENFKLYRSFKPMNVMKNANRLALVLSEEDAGGYFYGVLPRCDKLGIVA